MSKRIVCQICGRQIVSCNDSDKYVAPREGSVRLVNGVCCGDCSKDLNADGRFEGELP